MLFQISNAPLWHEDWGYILLRQGAIGIVVHPERKGTDWLASINNPHCGCPYHRYKFSTMEEARAWLIDLVERDTGFKISKHNSMGTKIIQKIMKGF